MIVVMPELNELEKLERSLEKAKTDKQIIKAKNALDVFWIRLRRKIQALEVLEKMGEVEG